MSSTNKTTYYELPQFVDNDVFNPLVDDNDAYSKIDTALHNIANAEADDASEIVSAKSRLDSAETDIVALKSQNGTDVLATVAQTLSGAVNELKSGEDSLDNRLDIVEDAINNQTTGLKSKVSAIEAQNGSEALTTGAQTLSGAINELDADNINIGTDVSILKAQCGNTPLTTVAQTLSSAVNELNSNDTNASYYVTPEEYGAVGDGVTDDSTAIQSAIDALHALGGGVLQFKNKTYICENLTVYDNITFKGANSVLKLPTTPAHNMISYIGNQVLSNFNLHDMKFDGNSQTNYDILHVEPDISDGYAWTDSVVINCTFSRAKRGIFCTIPGQVKVINTTFEFNDIGLEQNIEHFHVVNVIFWDNRIGAYVHQANHSTWVNAIFAHNDECGFKCDTGSTECVLNACSFIDQPVAISGRLNGYRIIGCRIMIGTTGIETLGNVTVIDGCYIGKLTGDGIIFANDSVASAVTNCEFYLNNRDITLKGNNSRVDGCSFRQTSKNNIVVDSTDSVFGASIINNSIVDGSLETDNGYAAIHIIATSITAMLVANNLIRNSSVGKMSYAIDFDATFTQTVDILVACNVARSMKTAGYRIPSTSGFTQANNIGNVVTP